MKPQTNSSHSHRRLPRSLLRGLGRVLLPILTRTEITGSENSPEHGPLIVVGNHIATMETVLMVVYAPWQMELLGPGDIPPPPFMDAIARLHGYIPINRGNMDRAALNRALSVLKHGGILGMFPEGGIWDTGEKPAKRGVAWLSYRAQAPMLPIGFGGLAGAMNAALSLKRPHLTMNVGQIIPAVTVPSGVSRKDALDRAAQQVMQAITALIPEEYKDQAAAIQDERFNLEVHLTDAKGNAMIPPSNLVIHHADALCKMWYRPAILRIFTKDIGLDVGALQDIQSQPAARALVKAIAVIQDYLKVNNPAFFIYRFGMEEGLAMEYGLEELKALAQWATDHHLTLSIQPGRTYHYAGQENEIVESSPGAAHSW
ncbi:MAG: lysophospholipid acyltransferase family protein [Anaerolineae bacterium]|nr:lysophospholipid acyltransferase family protein [Anaerolineae bacterium]